MNTEVPVITSFQAALTMSGIAGMVLSLGMAVDANVLIYERTKEELRAEHCVRICFVVHIMQFLPTFQIKQTGVLVYKLHVGYPYQLYERYCQLVRTGGR